MARPGDAQGDQNDVEPVARCANGHEAAPGLPRAKFCTVCGAPMMVRCPNGHEVAAAAHCTVCGLPLTADAVTPGAETVPEAATLPPKDSARESPRRPWLTIAGAALLVLVVGGGAYFGVSSLTGSSGGKPTNGAAPPQSSSSSTRTAPPSPAPAPSASVTRPPTVTPPPTVTAIVPPNTVTASPPPTVTVNPPTVTAPPSLTGPSEVVNEYFAAINAGDYARAWALGGANLQGGSYASFVQGFATTAYDSVTILSVTGDTATIHLDALQTDGTHRYFAGTYTVRGGTVVAADIRQTAS